MQKKTGTQQIEVGNDLKLCRYKMAIIYGCINFILVFLPFFQLHHSLGHFFRLFGIDKKRRQQRKNGCGMNGCYFFHIVFFSSKNIFQTRRHRYIHGNTNEYTHTHMHTPIHSVYRVSDIQI